MSTHPNAILFVALTPDDLTRRTMRAILAENEVKEDEDVKIGAHEYTPLIMEDEYDDNWQISAKEGDLVFLNMFTYGYGEVLTWDALEAMKIELETWAKEMCDKFICTYEIFVTANYW